MPLGTGVWNGRDNFFIYHFIHDSFIIYPCAYLTFSSGEYDTLSTKNLLEREGEKVENINFSVLRTWASIPTAHSLTVPVMDKSRLQVSGLLWGQMGIKNTALPVFNRLGFCYPVAMLGKRSSTDHYHGEAEASPAPHRPSRHRPLSSLCRSHSTGLPGTVTHGVHSQAWGLNGDESRPPSCLSNHLPWCRAVSNCRGHLFCF